MFVCGNYTLNQWRSVFWLFLEGRLPPAWWRCNTDLQSCISCRLLAEQNLIRRLLRKENLAFTHLTVIFTSHTGSSETRQICFRFLGVFCTFAIFHSTGLRTTQKAYHHTVTLELENLSGYSRWVDSEIPHEDFLTESDILKWPSTAVLCSVKSESHRYTCYLFNTEK